MTPHLKIIVIFPLIHLDMMSIWSYLATSSTKFYIHLLNHVNLKVSIKKGINKWEKS